MKYLILFSFVLIVAGCGGNSQPETDPAINIPVDEVISGIAVPDLGAGIDLADQNVCRVNMLAVSTSITMYQVQHGEFPSSLEEISRSGCPDAGAYGYTLTGQSWKLECLSVPSHGFIENGNTSW